MVELVKEHQREKLAGLVAQRKSIFHHVDVDAKQLIDTRVNAALIQNILELSFQLPVVNAGKEMADIAFQHPAFNTVPTPAVIVHHVGF